MAAHIHTHMHAHTTQSQQLYHTCIHVHVRTCTHVPVWKVQQSICIAVMSSGRGIEESSVLEVSATEYLPELSPIHLQYINETSHMYIHVLTTDSGTMYNVSTFVGIRGHTVHVLYTCTVYIHVCTVFYCTT